MKYNFDFLPNRKNTNSVKWDGLDELFGDKYLLPLWVADMDIMVPNEVIEAIKKRAEHGIFGYTTENTGEYKKVIINWFNKRYNVFPSRESLVVTPGIVYTLNLLVRIFTEENDNVIIQRPVYYPFSNVIKNTNRRILNNKLLIDEKNNYSIDFEDFERKAKNPHTKMFIFCNPHNPIGKVWAKNDIEKLLKICSENNVLFISDEVHSDFIYEGYKHTSVLSFDNYLNNIIVCHAGSKTFNLASLHTSNIFIPNRRLRKRFVIDYKLKYFTPSVNPFGLEALIAAYTHGEEWLDELLLYLRGNYEYIKEFVRDKLPKIKVTENEGTYLAWLDFRPYNLDKDSLTHLLRNIAKIALDEGYFFGEEGEGFARINFACPRSIVIKAMNRIYNAMKEEKLL